MTAPVFTAAKETQSLTLRSDQIAAIETYQKKADVDAVVLHDQVFRFLEDRNPVAMRAVRQGTAALPLKRLRGARETNTDFVNTSVRVPAEDRYLLNYLAAHAGVSATKYYRAIFDQYLAQDRTKAGRAAFAKLETAKRPWRRALGRKKIRKSAARARRGIPAAA